MVDNSKLSHSEAGKLGYQKALPKLRQLQKDRKSNYNNNPKLCKQCKKPIPYERRNNNFCNQSCSATYNNQKRKKKQKNECLNCKKELKRKNQKFCSNKCQQTYIYKKYIENWKNGKEDGLIGKYSLSSHIRHYMLTKANYKCEKCGWNQRNQFTGQIPLEVHHKDGDFRNNKEENLEVLCPNCHSLTSNYKSMNKKGRKERKKYYQC